MFAFLVVALAPPPPAPSAADGAFRLAVREVVCRRQFEQPEPVCEVGLVLCWQTPLVVVRVAQTGLTGWTPNSFPEGKIAVAGDRHQTTVRAAAVKRTDLTLPRLEVTFTVTAADRMLNFTIPDLTAPKPQTQSGVTVKPYPPRPFDGLLDFRLDLTYPEGHPEFESFETWTATNRCRLVHRDGRTVTEQSFDQDPRGRTVTVRHRFAAAEVGDPGGWSLVYDTPGPLREFPVRFTLRDIPLP
jgi:hypothetical protein